MAAQRIRLMGPTVTYISTQWPFITTHSVWVTTSSCSATRTTATRRQQNRTSGIARIKPWSPSRTKIPGSVSSRNTLFWISTAGLSAGLRTAFRDRRVLTTAALAPIRWSVARSLRLTIEPVSTLAWSSRGPTPRWCRRSGSSRWADQNNKKRPEEIGSLLGKWMSLSLTANRYHVTFTMNSGGTIHGYRGRGWSMDRPVHSALHRRRIWSDRDSGSKAGRWYVEWRWRPYELLDKSDAQRERHRRDRESHRQAQQATPQAHPGIRPARRKGQRAQIDRQMRD